MQKRVTKAIFPMVGMRFLPAMRSIPNKIMAFIDRPLVHYVIDEARVVGIKELFFVTSRGKSALENYSNIAPEPKNTLREKSKFEMLPELKSTNIKSGAIAYIYLHKALGLDHAAWCARRLFADVLFAVIHPDDVIAVETPCLKKAVEVYDETGDGMFIAMEVPEEKVSSYSMIEIKEDFETIVSVNGLVEKPPSDEVPSSLAVIWCNILWPLIMQNLNKIKSGVGGKVQLTDEIEAELKDGHDLFGFRFSGKRFGRGTRGGFLKATTAFGLTSLDQRELMLMQQTAQ